MKKKLALEALLVELDHLDDVITKLHKNFKKDIKVLMQKIKQEKDEKVISELQKKAHDTYNQFKKTLSLLEEYIDMKRKTIGK